MPDTIRTVGRYELIREIGRGGMAVVYMARQLDLERNVAMKELAAFHAGDPSFAQRFLRESRLAGSLNHPNVVTVHEYLEHEGTPYIVMEYLARGSLRPHVGSLSMAQVIGVLEGVLSGLAHAAAIGIVHRDLKPENLMVTSDGRTKIADFGIAKAVDSVSRDSFRTATGTTVGTPVYMAPEQAMGTNIGPWTDLYSVGIIAYELLAGHLPFPGNEPAMAILMHHLNDPVPPLTRARPDVDPELARWVHRLLAKDPAERIDGAAAAWDELEEVAIGALGPRWRREARLLEREPSRPTPRPLTPAPFDGGAAASDSTTPESPSPAEGAAEGSAEPAVGDPSEMAPDEGGEPAAGAEPEFVSFRLDRAAPSAWAPATEEGQALEAEALEADVVEPEAIEPEALEPEAIEPEALEPGAIEPEALEPGAIEPEALEPEAIEPDAVEPDAVEPEAVEPEASESAPSSIPGGGIARAGTKPESEPETDAGVEPGFEPGVQLESERALEGESEPDPAPQPTPGHEPRSRPGGTVPAAGGTPGSADSEEGRSPVADEKALEPTIAPRVVVARPSDAAVDAPSRPRRVGPVVVVVAIVIAGLVGWSTRPAPEQPAGPTVSSLSNDAIAIDVPGDWREVAGGPAVDRLGSADPLVVGPRGSAAGGYVVAGAVSPVEPSLLSRDLLRSLAGAPPDGEPVRLGDVVALRYSGLELEDGGERLTVYSAPTSEGAAMLACVAVSPVGGFQRGCERVAASLELRSGEALPLTPGKAYADELNQALRNLAGARRTGRAELARAETPRRQATAAGRLSTAFTRAAAAVGDLDVAPRNASANAAIVAALKRAAAGYADLARAAGRNQRQRYQEAAAAVRRAERAVRDAVDGLAKAGYTVT